MTNSVKDIKSQSYTFHLKKERKKVQEVQATE